MAHIHVCLVSEQTVPNILGIHYLRPDDVLFITTSKMNERSKVAHILDTLKEVELDYNGRYNQVEVREDSILDCKQKLDIWINGKEESDFSVNLTGGTKIMSIAAYEYFKEYGCTMIYVPVGRNDFITVFPRKTSIRSTPLSLRLSVANYLAAYGSRVTNRAKLVNNRQDAEKRKDFSEWIVTHYAETKSLLERFSEKLRKRRDDRNGYYFKTSYVPQNSFEKEFFEAADFSCENGIYSKHLSQSEIIYLTGGWLEEYCYNEIARFQNQGIDDAVIGIIAEAEGHKNEFDVMFTKDNALYTVECKSLDQNDDRKAEALYKIAALQKDFGLRVESFYVSTSPHVLKNGEIRPSIIARAEQFKTVVVPPHEVKNIGNIVAKRLHIQ